MQNQAFYDWRKYLINLLHGITQRENMHISTYWLAVSLFDRFALTYEMKKEDVQIIGITILIIASKVEDIETIDYLEVSHMLSKKYSVSDFIKMEILVLRSLNFELVMNNTAYYYLKKFMSLCDTMEESTKQLASYYAESTLKEEFSVTCSPSLFASTALFLALVSDDVPIWTEEHVTITSFTKEDIFPLAHCFLKTLKRTDFYEGSMLHSVRQKYQRPEFMSVSTLPLPDLEKIVFVPVDEVTTEYNSCCHVL